VALLRTLLSWKKSPLRLDTGVRTLYNEAMTTNTTNTNQETTSVLIKIDLDDLINMDGYDYIWELADDALRHDLGNADVSLIDLTIEPEGVEGDLIIIRVTGYPDGLIDEDA
jgi:hypothetical protein